MVGDSGLYRLCLRLCAGVVVFLCEETDCTRLNVFMMGMYNCVQEQPLDNLGFWHTDELD